MRKLVDRLEELRTVFDECAVPQLIDMGFAKAECEQVLSAPDPCDQGIPTLAIGVFRAASPQLKDRYAFCGSWTNIAGEQEWLSLADMQGVVQDGRVMRNIVSQKEHWDGSAPWLFPFEQLSVFALDRENPESHTFLVWKDGEDEPEVWHYSGQEERKHPDLAAYISSMIDEYKSGMAAHGDG